jgi:hypothetical protein
VSLYVLSPDFEDPDEVEVGNWATDLTFDSVEPPVDISTPRSCF